MKILVLGNEFIEEDSFAKNISNFLKKDHKIIKINDSFQLLEELQKSSKKIIIVVKNLEELKILKIEDLKHNNILSAHDLDASFFLQLLNPSVKIIGLPQNPKESKISNILSQIQSHLTSKK